MCIRDRGGLCLEEDDCPYALQVSESLLCALWKEIQLGNTTASGSTLSPDYQNLTGTATAAPNGEISYSECPYLSDPNSFTACSLWCTLREVAESETCTDAPVCPYENATTPYDQTLCDLWNEAESLKNAGTSNTIDQSENVTCPYLDETSYSTELCSLWCEIQGLKSNKKCQTPCPFLGDPEETLFCELWEELQSLSNAAIEEAVSADPSTSYAVGPTPAPSYAVACKYEDHATNSTGLCDLWCDVIAYEGGLLSLIHI